MPIGLVQSENDYSAAPTRELAAELAVSASLTRPACSRRSG